MKKVYAKAIRRDVVTAGHQIPGNNMLMPEVAERSISDQTRLPKVNEKGGALLSSNLFKGESLFQQISGER